MRKNESGCSDWWIKRRQKANLPLPIGACNYNVFSFDCPSQIQRSTLRKEKLNFKHHQGHSIKTTNQNQPCSFCQTTGCFYQDPNSSLF
ncbi:hypothetical protein K1719_037290 [Acacia pycnantha]|nr:hypothetical protein K1719_037290 [Acacia pycnantha]